MKYLKRKMFSHEYTKKSYKDGFYIEAIQTLHSWMENRLQTLLLGIGTVKFGADSKNTWDVVNEISFKDALKILYVIGQFDFNEYVSLRELNSARNKLIHKMYFEPYEKEYKGFIKKDLDKIFKTSLRLSELIEDKIIKIYEEE